MLINKTILKIGFSYRGASLSVNSSFLKGIHYGFTQKSELEKLAKRKGGV
jgi:hypothetical protein